MAKIYCCFLDPVSGERCENGVEWNILLDGDGPDMSTQSCSEHLGDLCSGLSHVWEEGTTVKNPVLDGSLMKEFLAWWHTVDNELCLSDFDLALGWFTGKGLDHNKALEAAEKIRDVFGGTA